MNASPRTRRRFSRVVVLSAFAYPAALLLLVLGLYFIGERWWVTAAGLYVPRVPFVAPLPVLVMLLWVTGRKRLLWTQVLAALIALFPLLGFILPLPWPAKASRGPRLRVLSMNVDSARGGAERIATQIAALSPDVVLLQESPWNGGELLPLLAARFPYVASSTQFTIASRHRIIETTSPPEIPAYGTQLFPNFMRYVLDTPLGPIAFFSVHPTSPRGLMGIGQFRGAVHQVRTGKFLAGDPAGEVAENAGMRTLQIATASAAAARESLPLIIAGDTNLPGLSPVFRKYLTSYTDGFRAASWGFGYTYSYRRPFLRLDRILASQELRFVSFEVGCPDLSDHRCVVADIQALP